jgi:hypothetical protein
MDGREKHSAFVIRAFAGILAVHPSNPVDVHFFHLFCQSVSVDHLYLHLVLTGKHTTSLLYSNLV